MQAYRILGKRNNSARHPAGTICFPFTEWDSGLAESESRLTGVKHQSMSLTSNGGAPPFTVATDDLQPVESVVIPTSGDDVVLVVSERRLQLLVGSENVDLPKSVWRGVAAIITKLTKQDGIIKDAKGKAAVVSRGKIVGRQG